MKKIIYLFLISIFISACEKDTFITNYYDCEQVTFKIYYDKNVVACGVNGPQKNNAFLSEIIQKANNDKTGNYLGNIWLEKYKGNDVFVTDMKMGSGGIMYRFFDCSGNNIVPANKDSVFDEFVKSLKFNVLVYSNVYISN